MEGKRVDSAGIGIFRMRLVIMGPPGSGKGTQAETLAEHFKVPHISVGDLLRQEVADETEVGKQIESFLNKGELIPHDIMHQIVAKRLDSPDAENGWILDGYPRDIDQAEFLDQISEPEAVLVIDVPEELSIERISKRRVCEKCHEVYGINVKPKKDGVCDKCGDKLVHRDDDKPEAIKNRLEIYNDETEPLIAYYQPRDIVFKVDGSKDIKTLNKEIISILD